MLMQDHSGYKENRIISRGSRARAEARGGAGAVNKETVKKSINDIYEVSFLCL